MGTVHLTRGGQVVICLPCARDEHGGCLDERETNGGMVCHCKSCYPAPCEDCYPPDPNGHNRKGRVCGVCFIETPVSGVCEEHPLPVSTEPQRATPVAVTVGQVAACTVGSSYLVRRLAEYANLRLGQPELTRGQVIDRLQHSYRSIRRYERWLSRFCAENGLDYAPLTDNFSREHGTYKNSRGVRL